MTPDVIIVGGRPAGASLAARLGRLGRRVLVLERAEIAGAPAVPSCPTLHMGTIALLDELGVPESAYAGDAVRFSRFIVEFGAWFAAVMPFPTIHGRSYGLSIDRARFDPVLWHHLEQFPTVERRRFTVTGVGLAPWRGDSASNVFVHTTERGVNVLMFPLPDRTTICVHARADRVEVEGDAMAWYEATVRRLPLVAARLGDARPVGRVLGMKRVGNGYRTAGGPGWVLAGDAWHFKDPVDGQGIYDALLGTRILAEELEAGFQGKPADAVVRDYASRARNATHPMFVATVGRLANELYTSPPVPVIRTLLRWMLRDPVYQSRFIRFLGRDLDPATWLGPGVVLGSILRGIWGDLRGLFGRAPA